jgi:alpha-galactosidase
MTGVISATMVTPNTLSTADYGTIQAWLSGTELQRLNRVAVPASPGLTAAPLLQWNSYRSLGVSATCAQVKTQIDALVSGGWLAAGYTNIQAPINWALGTRDGSGNLQTDTSLCPLGMADLYFYAHAKGFTVTHYLTPVACSGVTIPSSIGYETQDAAQAASFGADRISYDSCGTSIVSEWQTMATAMIASGRTMELIVSNGTGNFAPLSGVMTSRLRSIPAP